MADITQILDTGAEQQIANTVSNSASTLGIVAYLVILLILIGGAIWLIIWALSYNKKKVQVYEHGSKGLRYRSFRAVSYKNRNGVVKWSLWEGFFNTLFRKNKTIEEPPSESTFFDEKGNSVAIGYMKNGTIVFSNLELNFSEKDLEKIKFDPFKQEDKSMLISELREAEDYKKKRLGEMILAATPFLALIIILVVLAAFYGEIINPSIKLADSNVQLMDKFGELTSKLDVLINNRQYIPAEQTSSGGAVQTKLPS